MAAQLEHLQIESKGEAQLKEIDPFQKKYNRVTICQ